ncbi:deoxyribodipyrimidine photo-lyase [Candidatus Cyanaurora vandensis]|uniref:cryptochrome/photolyase family protein n=1 Tax=Candidatus Cyanaurora vandensis TaxID=2714958 RepID=UPI00258084B6|nr:deoxyribodipyrimidine photo-lyase [Candidatus Cyanaurora vandensis]
MTILVWHRRDLRLQDNPALAQAVQTGAAVVSVFIFDSAILTLTDIAPIRVQFLLDSLGVLAENYRRIGGQLVLRQGDPVAVLLDLARETQATALYFNEDIEPFAQVRDQRVHTAFQEQGIAVQRCCEIMLHGPDEVLTGQGKSYGVFGPYWRNWVSRPKPKPYPKPHRLTTVELTSQPLPTLAQLGMSTDQPPVDAGEDVGLARLEEFCQPEYCFQYSSQRNLPAEDGTSRLSPHLRMGTVGIRTVWQATVELEADAYSDERLENLTAWRQELCWRDFYKYTLAYHPETVDQPYQRKYSDFAFNDNEEHFEQWCRGETGYPLVDAAMAQLNHSGWMHNRCRMVVASFLCKDLLIDWRKGALYFAQKLVDGDLAANIGGWQWSASMGTDPKPLRIFNPQTQLARFDPDGSYVRRWLPRLTRAEPKELMTTQNLHRYDYPRPMVDHKQQQELFKRRFQAQSQVKSVES